MVTVTSTSGAPPSTRRGHDSATIGKKLGFLERLRGTWEGAGFNLIARPDKQGNSPLFLELNQTFETLSIDPIASSIPNRGFAVNDIELFGLTYQQKIVDTTTGGALHIEPGMWVHVPSQDSSDGKTQSVFRVGTVPHGNALLAQGTAINLDPFPASGNPFDPDVKSAANTAPFKVNTPMPVPGTLGGFAPYDLSNLTAAAIDFRTPFGNNPAIPLPSTILGVPMQDVILDPVKLLTAALTSQTIVRMTVINVASVTSLLQSQTEGKPPVDILAGLGTGGGIENIPFLQTNADAATVFATFWLEEIQGAASDGSDNFLQLQYVQTVFLNFPILGSSPPVNLSWPHVSVATLQKTFGGQ